MVDFTSTFIVNFMNGRTAASQIWLKGRPFTFKNSTPSELPLSLADKTLEAFSHYTVDRSNNELIMLDFQGTVPLL